MRIYYTDGGTKNNGKFGLQESVICAVDEEGKILFFEQIGDKTNNEAELTAVLRLLETIPGEIEIHSDSQLIVNFLSRNWKTKILRLKLILNKIKNLNRKFEIKWIPREDNLAGMVIEERTGL